MVDYVNQGEIKNDIKKANIKKILQDALNNLPDHRTRKNDISLLQYACNILEEKVKKKYNINKLDLLYEVFEICFGTLTVPEKESINKNINYLLSSGAIKKVKRLNKMYKWIKNLL